jgi:hypothetical protein
MKLAIVLPIIAAIGLGWVALDQTRLVYSTSENESVFFTTYSPKGVIDRFKAADFSQQAAMTSGGAGREFATHEEDFEPTVVINAQDWVALMQALRDDIDSRLKTEHGEVIAESGNKEDGFKIEYVMGNTEGSVEAKPLESVPSATLAADGSGPGKITVSLTIQIHEKWFRSERQGRSKKAA